MRPAFFVVQRIYGREQPAIFWDELPREPLRNLVYVVRLDAFPNGEELCAAPLGNLMAVYEMLKKRGKLPPRYEPPPRANAEKPTPRAGHREELPGVRIARAEAAATGGGRRPATRARPRAARSMSRPASARSSRSARQ